MAYRNIVKVGDPILYKKSRIVEKFDKKLSVLLDDMLETVRRENGAGLSAVQVGVLKRVVIVDNDEKMLELINPEIIYSEGVQEEGEGCLSVPGEYGITSRPAIVKVKAQNRNGQWCIYKGEGLQARCFCHEIDHLNGILFTKRVIRSVE
ncbi:MAG TPA: peptide deformylase [Clostridia bacterium]|nr:peptide deformylase [Clostridia bacterium]